MVKLEKINKTFGKPSVYTLYIASIILSVIGWGFDIIPVIKQSSQVNVLPLCILYGVLCGIPLMAILVVYLGLALFPLKPNAREKVQRIKTTQQKELLELILAPGVIAALLVRPYIVLSLTVGVWIASFIVHTWRQKRINME